MRLDAFGMFWEDVPHERGGPARVMPPIPETGWKSLQPYEFPDLSKAVALGIDTETYDPELLTSGPGWARQSGHIVGVSVAAMDAFGGVSKWYFPIAHEVQPEDNVNKEAVIAWLKRELGRADQPKVGANILYDIGWLSTEGVTVAGRLHDVLFAEALLSESRGISLDYVANRYLNLGKTTDILYQWCAAYYGGPIGDKQRKNIYRAPPCLVGVYAEDDAALPLQLMEHLMPLIHQQGLGAVYDMECNLIPLTMAMRAKGIRVDTAKAARLSAVMRQTEEGLQARLDKIGGGKISVNSARDLAHVWDKLGLTYKRLAPTEAMLAKGITEGNPSFTKAILSTVNHPVAKLVLEIKRLSKLRGTFVDGYILGEHVNGRVHAQFNALRGEAGGTRSGRWSSSNPNLQNIPARDPVWAPQLRGLFVPDDHHGFILAPDYSQIEYRNLAHFARGESGRKLREIYNSAGDTDYHAITQQMVEKVLGLTIKRKPIKNLNFGLIYGMGVPTLLEMLNIPEKEGRAFIDAYHAAAPYARETMDYYTEFAQKNGYIKTIMGRISRFNLWEPRQWSRDSVPPPRKVAERTYGTDIIRAGGYKALNRVLQGSSADELKKAMLDCWEAGLFNGDNVPRLTVHDELVFSKETNSITDEWSLAVQDKMVNVMPALRVPLTVDMDIGVDWGHVTESVPLSLK